MLSLQYILTYFFVPHYDTGVDSASNRNEYQKYFLGLKVAGAKADNRTTFVYRLSGNL